MSALAIPFDWLCNVLFILLFVLNVTFFFSVDGNNNIQTKQTYVHVPSEKTELVTKAGNQTVNRNWTEYIIGIHILCLFWYFHGVMFQQPNIFMTFPGRPHELTGRWLVRAKYYGLIESEISFDDCSLFSNFNLHILSFTSAWK